MSKPAPRISDAPVKPRRWPVWLVSAILAGWTYFDGYQMAVVPPDSVVVRNEPVESLGGERRDVLIAPPDTGFNLASVETREADGTPAANTKGALAPASMTVARTNSLGVIFVATLFLVALISTLTLRGLVSLFVIITGYLKFVSAQRYPKGE